MVTSLFLRMQASTSMPQSTLTKNIVVYADDDQDDLELVKDAFTQYTRNVEVLTFLNGSEALAYLMKLSDEDIIPCLIILDINMPILNGKEALQRIRFMERFNSVPIVLFTTSSQPTDKAFAQQYNAGFITKPIELKQMEYIADQFVEHCTEETRKRIQKSIK